ncbi:hypothetical protein RHGRI_005145 [Rhododendron griersonianum]|uniref:AT-hook motif nuclear-localized protein n=1 Tax=Rhododendron griersonianum TaxID=479676 RepID=A0AAV6LB58_9ERIC|nr:hypothetical protein RHGRI_005145 [Rhododendron griersonianum]
MRLFFRGTHLLLFDGKPQFVDMSLSCVLRVSSDEGVWLQVYFGNSCGSGGGSGSATMPTSQPSSSTPSTHKSAT